MHVACRAENKDKDHLKPFEIMSHNFSLDWLLFCSIWRNHEELTGNKKSNFICLEKEEVFQDCLEQQQQLYVRDIGDEGERPFPSVDYSSNIHNPTRSMESNIVNEDQESYCNNTATNQKLLLVEDDPPQSTLGDRDGTERKCIGLHVGNPSRHLREEEHLNPKSFIEKQLMIKNSSDSKIQSGNDLLQNRLASQESEIQRRLREEEYQSKIASLQLQLENCEKVLTNTLQQKLQEAHVQFENQLLLKKGEIDAERSDYEKKIEILHRKLSSVEEERNKCMLGVNENETEQVRDLQNKLRLLEVRCAEQQAALQSCTNTECSRKLSMLQSQVTELETEHNRSLQKQMEQIEKQFAERELKQKQIIVQTISSEYQDQILSLKRQLIDCETEKVQCIQDKNIQLVHDMEAMKAKLDDAVAASTEYLGEISALRMEMVHSAKRHEVQIKSLQEKHSKEITELISQLDDFIEEQDESSCKKDEAIASLSSQIVEARAVATKLEHEKMILVHQNEVLEKSICLLQDGALKQKEQFESEMEQVRKESLISLEREQNIRKDLSKKIERFELALKESKSKELSYKNQLGSAMHELDKSQINCKAAQSSLAHLVSLKHSSLQYAASIVCEESIETMNKLKDIVVSIDAASVTSAKPASVS